MDYASQPLDRREIGRLHQQILAWYDVKARDLPWRSAGATPWHVMVSEFMLQQTPVSRVLPVYERWLEEWPTPVALAAAPSGEAVRAWGRLGYPRRALRLHSCAVAITTDHAGVVPGDVDELRALPGVGEYTAAAIASFAYKQRHAVLDTNVRRVFARVARAKEFPGPSLSVVERRFAETLLPDDEATAARWSVAVMELGALTCTAATPRCNACPIASTCRWRRAGYPAHDGPPRRGQSYAGTDRQCRGRLLAVLRDSDRAVPRESLVAVWDDAQQRERALNGLVADGLVEPLEDDLYALPR